MDECDEIICSLDDITDTFEIVNTTVIDTKLHNLMEHFNLPEAYQPFIESGFTFERLKFIRKEDLDEVFPERKYCGLKAELREKIFHWKTENFSETPSTISANSIVSSWIYSCSEGENSQNSDSNPTSCHPEKIKTVGDILKLSNSGRSILNFYAKNNALDSDNRKKMLNVLVEHFYDATNLKHNTLRLYELEKLAEEIVAVFPTENKDIYFLSRKVTKKI